MRSALAVALFLAGLLVGIGLSGRAQDYVIGSGIAIHLDGEHHCNWRTTGLGYEHSQGGNWRSQVGFFRNSNCRWATYAAEAWTPLRWGRISGGLLFGAVTGYGSPLLPAGGFVAAYEGIKYGLNLIFIPPVGESGNVIWLQAKVAF